MINFKFLTEKELRVKFEEQINASINENFKEIFENWEKSKRKCLESIDNLRTHGFYEEAVRDEKEFNEMEAAFNKKIADEKEATFQKFYSIHKEAEIQIKCAQDAYVKVIQEADALRKRLVQESKEVLST